MIDSSYRFFVLTLSFAELLNPSKKKCHILFRFFSLLFNMSLIVFSSRFCVCDKTIEQIFAILAATLFLPPSPPLYMCKHNISDALSSFVNSDTIKQITTDREEERESIIMMIYYNREDTERKLLDIKTEWGRY